MRTVKFSSGDTILTEGEEGNTAFLIVEGSVDVTVGDEADARSVGSLGAGEVFGEMRLICPGPRSATIRAITDTECVETSYDEFMVSLQENPERAVQFIQTLVGRLRHMNELLAGTDGRGHGLRAIFKDWKHALGDVELKRREVEKLHPMF